MQLHESYRPHAWSDVIGQDKALAKIDALRKRGLSGRSYWISGQSGTGKTTIARLIAAEVAEADEHRGDRRRRPFSRASSRDRPHPVVALSRRTRRASMDHQ